ncbi:hypothetical protein L1987_45449 [Smallanthus sonchifolius]|uniref:Uncharacterized protein n=1 Tax=Smallanthus sonchifolius TaxID=185202 RepID=A0ACB9FY16_9ASTR|nr:hypothetical protein L1987_45449 [Smallanthus sonchifolius]
MADTTEIPPQVYEHLCSQACIDKVLGYRKHNQNLIDQNEVFHQMKSEFKKVEDSYKEKINCLKKEISSLRHEQTNIETQIDDLLARLKATRTELAEQKVHVDKYEISSKKLQRLLDAQIHEKVKTGLGYHAEQYQAVAPPADYVTIHEPSFNLANLDMANINLDPSKDEPLVQECTTSSESESTCSDSSEISEASSPPAPQVILTKDEVPIIHSAPVAAISVPVPTPFKQIKISYPPEGMKLKIEKGQSSTSIQPKKVKKDRHKSVLKPSAANKTAADRVKPKQPKGKPSAAKSGAAHVKPSAATKYASDQSKPSDVASAAEKAKRAGKPPTQQWKAKKPPSIIIGSVECVDPLL